MPEISRFFGIIITMFYSDHQPPHFHVRYGEYKAQVTIDPISILRSKNMLKDIIRVKPLKDFRLHLEFEDGIKGEVDISKLIKFTGVFEPLQDKDFFGKVAVNPEWGTIFWPNGADLDPDVLYSMITGEEIPEIIPLSNK